MNPRKLPRAACGHVLTLDIATCTGWCGGGFWSRPRMGAVQLAGARPVEKWANLRQWLDDYQDVSGRVTALILEAAILTSRDTGNDIELLWGLRHMAIMWAFDCGLSEGCIVSYASSSVRAHMLGDGRIPAREVKGHVMDWCSRNGMPTTNHNAADATITWSYGQALLDGTPRAQKGLFANQAPMMLRGAA